MDQHFIYLSFILIGFFCLYKGTLEQKDLQVIEGPIVHISLAMIGHYSNGPAKYAAVVKFENSNERYGMELGTLEDGRNSVIFDIIKKNEVYKIFVDPTISKGEGIDLGVVKVEQGNKILYERDEGRGYILIGLIFILSSSFFWRVFVLGQKELET